MIDLSPAALAVIWRSAWTQGALAFTLWVAAGLLLRRYLIKLLKQVARRTRWTWDDVLLRAVSTPSLIAIVASGLLIAGRILPLGAARDRVFDLMLAAALALERYRREGIARPFPTRTVDLRQRFAEPRA